MIQYKSIKSFVTSTYVLVLISVIILLLTVNSINVKFLKNTITIILLLVFFACLILEAFNDLSNKYFTSTLYIGIVDIMAILVFIISVYYNIEKLSDIYTILTSITILIITRHGDFAKIQTK